MAAKKWLDLKKILIITCFLAALIPGGCSSTQSCRTLNKRAEIAVQTAMDSIYFYAQYDRWPKSEKELNSFCISQGSGLCMADCYQSCERANFSINDRDQLYVEMNCQNGGPDMVIIVDKPTSKDSQSIRPQDLI